MLLCREPAALTLVLCSLLACNGDRARDLHDGGPRACCDSAGAAGDPADGCVACAPLLIYDYAADKALGLPGYYDAQVLVTALQGIVNRDAARLYVKVPADPGYQDFWYLTRGAGAAYSDYDQYWLDRLIAHGDVGATRAVDLDGLLDAFADRVHGLVLWDEATPATLDAAFTVAGVDDLLPVRYSTDPASLYFKLIARGLPIVRDLRDLHGKRATYEWLLATYVDSGRADPTWLGYVLDGFYLRYPEVQAAAPADALGQHPSHHIYNDQIASRDYLVARRGVFFDLQPYAGPPPVDAPDEGGGTDLALLTRLLEAGRARLPPDRLGTMIGFPSWAWKYTDTSCQGLTAAYGAGAPPCASTMQGWEVEWRLARLISQHDFLLDADAIHPAGMSNASVFMHFPVATRAPNRRPLHPPAYDPDTIYVHFYMGDFDSASWIWFHARFLWDDPARGQIPVSWGFDPNLSERVGPMFQYYFDTATPNDYFVGGDSGAGYINPGYLDPVGLDRWEAHCQHWFDALGYDATGWALNGFAGGLSPEVARRFSHFSPTGVITYDGQSGAPDLTTVGDTPFVREPLDHVGVNLTLGSPAAAAEAILAAAPSYRMVAIRNVLLEPSRLVLVANELAARGAVVVDPYTFFDFARRRIPGAAP